MAIFYFFEFFFDFWRILLKMGIFDRIKKKKKNSPQKKKTLALG
jgi:hypothetical protein